MRIEYGLALGVDSGQIIAGGGQHCIYGFAASGYGAGGSGNTILKDFAAASGFAGNAGICIVWE